MQRYAAEVVLMGVDVAVLLWICLALVVAGLSFALAGRRPARRERKEGLGKARAEAHDAGAPRADES